MAPAMHVPLATLGTLLDLPAGVSVARIDTAGDVAVLHLEGVEVEGLDSGADVVSAEYDVDAKGRRSFGRFTEASEADRTHHAALYGTGKQEPPPTPPKRRGGS